MSINRVDRRELTSLPVVRNAEEHDAPDAVPGSVKPCRLQRSHQLGGAWMITRLPAAASFLVDLKKPLILRRIS
jgi:hypothetical protein